MQSWCAVRVTFRVFNALLGELRHNKWLICQQNHRLIQVKIGMFAAEPPRGWHEWRVIVTRREGNEIYLSGCRLRDSTNAGADARLVAGLGKR
ncbi:hypothetical protein KB20921_10500 [Edwardsiella ictaluri]|nr:hypothetical protein KH20906_10170 [Edwardsiella ictaluri]BEI01789.1 hypothetical protein KB20921_10500 [Edwardsiella ictaluri]BEI05257.1 hypothetical protein KH201010_10430 [Edwardsiella ictaluri]BEI08715.1 hypothetical protein STU22726_10460 [Edwardsiella ictaluri]BEI12196.1 hypothetical protein STU22816_10490 [Edwardsiella ictaluri]